MFSGHSPLNPELILIKKQVNELPNIFQISQGAHAAWPSFRIAYD